MTDELIRKSDALAVARSLFRLQTSGLYGAKGVTEYGLLTDTVADAIAALPAVTVGVKPLEWHQTSTEPARWVGHQADVSNPDYVIHLTADSPDVFAWGLDGDGWYGFCDTIDAAKAAAQADYDARILAALEPVALTPKPVDASQTADPAVKALDDLARLGQEFDAAPDPAAIREAALREAAKRITELMTREVKSAVGDGYNLGLGTAYDAILALIPTKGAADDRA